MDNISWSKTVGNWGKNQDLSKTDVIVEEKKEEVKLSFEKVSNSKSEIINLCENLIEKSCLLYDNFSSKELHDAIITLHNTHRSLNLITIKETKKEN